MCSRKIASMADPTVLRLADLPTRKATKVLYAPDAIQMGALAAELELTALRKLRLEGMLTPMGKTDWQLDARLGATVVQPCVVTLEPVTTRIDEDVRRRYIADWQPPTEAEAEMLEDETIEALPAALDLAQVAAEALTLAVPDFPRVEGAALDRVNYAEDGVIPLSDEDVKPFAGLAALKAKLEGPRDN